MKEHIRENVSRRSYECLLLDWTDALGIYDDSVDENTYELTFLRAMQLSEMCILIRRAFKSLEYDVDDLARTLSILLPRPFAVNRILQRFRTVDRRFVVSPPVCSVEAEALMRAGFERFGVDVLRKSASNSCDFLDRHFQWEKTQFLVAVGVVTYLLDKLKLFDFAGRWIHVLAK